MGLLCDPMIRSNAIQSDPGCDRFLCAWHDNSYWNSESRGWTNLIFNGDLVLRLHCCLCFCFCFWFDFAFTFSHTQKHTPHTCLLFVVSKSNQHVSYRWDITFGCLLPKSLSLLLLLLHYYVFISISILAFIRFTCES